MASNDRVRFDLTDPLDCARWFIAELHRLGMIEDADAAKDDEAWEELDDDVREPLTHAFANFLKAQQEAAGFVRYERTERGWETTFVEGTG